MTSEGAKTTRDYWEQTHGTGVRLKLPSTLVAGIGDTQRLLRKYIRPGGKVLEIGFAPGKQLAYVAKVLNANVAGIDFSAGGVAMAERLFAALGITGDLRCEDMFQSTMPLGAFDLVYSIGVVEHFDDPRDIIRRHVEFVKPGGTALIMIPNYGGIYGRLQRSFDPENLAIHNVEMMSVEALAATAPADLARSVRTFPFGRVNGWIVNFQRKWPAPVAKAIWYSLNGLALLQPVQIPALCPNLALEVTRA